MITEMDRFPEFDTGAWSCRSQSPVAQLRHCGSSYRLNNPHINTMKQNQQIELLFLI